MVKNGYKQRYFVELYHHFENYQAKRKDKNYPRSNFRNASYENTSVFVRRVGNSEDAVGIPNSPIDILITSAQR